MFETRGARATVDVASVPRDEKSTGVVVGLANVASRPLQNVKRRTHYFSKIYDSVHQGLVGFIHSDGFTRGHSYVFSRISRRNPSFKVQPQVNGVVIVAPESGVRTRAKSRAIEDVEKFEHNRRVLYNTEHSHE